MRHRGTKRLETERLVLRPFGPDDARAMYDNWASDPQVTRYLTWPPHASPAVTGQLIGLWVSEYEHPGNYNWAMELKQTGELIGSISVVKVNEPICEAELGYCMGRRWWGKGLMSEAGREAVRYLLKEVGFNRVCAKHDVENPKSGRVMQKIGMTFEGVQRQAGVNNRGIVDMAVYAVLRSDLT